MNQKTNTTSRPLRRAVLVLALVAGAALAQPAASADSDLAFDVAMAAYERNHWETAYAGFASLAERSPVTLIVGARDQMTPPRAAGEIAAALKARVNTLTSGHLLMSETPDAVLAALRAALN